MNKFLLIGGLAACMPLLANADEAMHEELNGLNIETSLSPVASNNNAGSTTATGDGTHVLKVTNHSDQVVECRVQPGPSDSPDPLGDRATLQPGKGATLKVDARSTGNSIDAKLVCMPAHTS